MEVIKPPFTFFLHGFNMEQKQIKYGFNDVQNTDLTIFLRIRSGEVFIDNHTHTDYANDWKLNKSYQIVLNLKTGNIITNETPQNYIRVLCGDRFSRKLNLEEYVETSMLLKQKHIIYNKKLGNFYRV